MPKREERRVDVRREMLRGGYDMARYWSGYICDRVVRVNRSRTPLSIAIALSQLFSTRYGLRQS